MTAWFRSWSYNVVQWENAEGMNTFASHCILSMSQGKDCHHGRLCLPECCELVVYFLLIGVSNWKHKMIMGSISMFLMVARSLESITAYSQIWYGKSNPLRQDLAALDG